MYGRVERHSLCPVFTSLEFKWSTGRLRLPFTSRHLHFPLHTVHSQLLIQPHPSTLHTNSHTYSTNIFSHAFFPHTQTNIYRIVYKPLTTIHKCRCAHGINTACGHSFFLLEYQFFIQFTAINHPVITHSSTYTPTNLFLTLTYTYMQTQTHAQSLFELWAAVSCALSPIWALQPSNMQFCLCTKTETYLCIHPPPSQAEFSSLKHSKQTHTTHNGRTGPAALTAL